MNAWESPGAAAVHALHEQLELDEDTAKVAVDIVFENLVDPDRDMLQAGAAEMAPSLPKGGGSGYGRELAALVWRAMLQRARP
jgi:hypothetical protein